MNRVLRKRLGRELKTNFARYLALVLLIVMGMYIIVSVVASADTIIDGTAEHGKQNKVEDGQFGVFIPLTDEQEKEITDKGITLEQHFSIDVTAKDGSKLRVFRKRNDIDLIELDSGRLAEKKGEAVVEKRYSEEHSLSVGDKLTAGGVEFEIVGIGTIPDYDTPFENFSDTAVSSKGFGLLFVSDDQYDYFKNDSDQKAEDLCYAYRLNGKATDDELKEMIEDFDFDYKKVTDKYYLETIKDVLKQRDDISNGIDKLYDGSQTLKDGVKDLSEGADALYDAMGGLYEGTKALPEGANAITAGVKAAYDGSKDLSEGARSAYSGAESLANGIDSFKKQADELLDEVFTIDLDNLTMFVKKGDNVRIAGAAGDVVMNKYAGLGVGVILMALLTYVISVFVIHQIQRESSVIGALYALGAKKKDLIRHYVTLPTIVAFVGGMTDDPAMDGWKSVVDIFNEAKMPFVVMMGNHDAEYLTRNEIYDFLLKSPYYVGAKGPEDIMGCGNCVISIYSPEKKDQVEALLYCMDSNDYQPNKIYGAYDWIHFDQIEWYRKQSKHFAEKNGGNPVPALAFFHIPLIEYNEIRGDGKTYGNDKEGGVASANINSGMFASFLDMRDVMGVFVGHDHDNDFIGIDKGIALGYGRVTGADAYGELTRGARIIELYEDQFKFDTWISTPSGREAAYYYPSGLNSDEEQSMAYLPATGTSPKKQGVAYTYYEGKCKRVADIAACNKVKEGVMKNFSIEEVAVPDHFAYDFRTLVKIPERGVYRFYTFSDDGSKLYIDGKLIVDNDGGHSGRRAEGKVALEAGYHELHLLYFEDYMGQELEVGYSGRNVLETVLPDTMLFVPD